MVVAKDQVSWKVDTRDKFDVKYSNMIFCTALQKVQRRKPNKDENVITYTYPLKRNKNITISF